ncbi:MAG: diguanylate cyclase [Leptospiraceae bacterium]|nr:diguanylate cyclase [Leptospiraceae bacterium]
MQKRQRDDSAIEMAIEEIDDAVKSHMDWTRHLLRLCLLGEPPGPDMIDPDGHSICHFGHWLQENQVMLQQYDPDKEHRLCTAHEDLHNAIRKLLIQERSIDEKRQLMDAFEVHQTALIDMLSHFRNRLEESRSHYDPLTGLPLRHFLENSFLEFQRRTRRNKTLFYIALIDVDHFKAVNDQFGHVTGDDALAHLAGLLLKAFRENEPLYRLGGEEFLHFLEVENESQALAALHRAMNLLRVTPLATHSGEIDLTLTIGLAHVGSAEVLREAMERADSAMYRGKRTGRNRCVVAEPPAALPAEVAEPH